MFEETKAEMPSSLQWDLIDYIYMGFIAQTQSETASREILGPKIQELIDMYPNSLKQTKVIPNQNIFYLLRNKYSKKLKES